ncbi:hypothetical protein A1Q2_02509 [Trichosporon asahii var. asahii CBS 8904]|uniref:Uncharacterized protein n=1 Tax=Trichosporon asahii var. asahii (strain CBS 8904) TaxID=1220162 RepID=K1VGG9_TRIAC|nr:hypothetical protein A1Q2_02509 [Trichosporon asahii var. asahii CBS 8904]
MTHWVSPPTPRSKANAIAAGVIGAVVGAGVLFVVVLHLVRRRKRRQAQATARHRREQQLQVLHASRHRPHLVPTFEPTEDVQVITPYPAPSRPSPSSRSSTDRISRSKTAKPRGPRDRQGTTKTPIVAKKQSSALSEEPRRPQANAPGIVNNSEAATSGRHRAEDMEDAPENELLPPEYKEEWGQRHSAALEEARVVDPLGKGGRLG